MGEVISFKDYKETRTLPPKVFRMFGVVIPKSGEPCALGTNPEGKVIVSPIDGDPIDFVNTFEELLKDSPALLIEADLPFVEVPEGVEDE